MTMGAFFMRRKQLYITMVCIMVLLASAVCPVQAAPALKIGDYVQMGQYYDEPILWRVIDVNENDPLLVSDNAIALKVFDAAGDNPSGSHSRDSANQTRKNQGSSFWADSNLRSWLNSDAPAGQVQWLCGNPPTKQAALYGYNAYADEKGFLADGNFTQTERNAIKPVQLKTMVSPQDDELATAGTIKLDHYVHFSIKKLPENFDQFRTYETTDKMFVLGLEQMNTLFANRDILGETYFLPKLTEKAITNGDERPEVYNEKVWQTWMRDPYASIYSPNDVYYGDYVTIVSMRAVPLFEKGNERETVHFVAPNFYAQGAVRPAFYMDVNAAAFKEGDGTEAKPYVVDRDKANTLPPAQGVMRGVKDVLFMRIFY